MSSQRTPRTNVTVVALPNEVDTGQFIQVSAALTDEFGASVFANNIYMQIVDSTGRVVWSTQSMAENQSGFSLLVSTNELKPNTRYTVRVAPNNKFVHMGFTTFKTSKNRVPIAIPLVFVPSVLIPEAAKNPIELIYRTKRDTRVDDICLQHEGKRFKPNDPNIIRIGPPDLGGQTHWGCRCVYIMVLAQINPAKAKADSIRAVALVSMAVIKHKKKMEIN